MEYVQVESPFPFLERRFGEVGLLGNIEDIVQQENPTPELAECAYHLGYFEEASAVADAVSKSYFERSVRTMKYSETRVSRSSLSFALAFVTMIEETIEKIRQGRIIAAVSKARFALASLPYLVKIR